MFPFLPSRLHEGWFYGETSTTVYFPISPKNRNCLLPPFPHLESKQQPLTRASLESTFTTKQETLILNDLTKSLARNPKRPQRWEAQVSTFHFRYHAQHPHPRDYHQLTTRQKRLFRIYKPQFPDHPWLPAPLQKTRFLEN
ncbi:hypothetical protein KC19_5G076100 [Ceratodon purpureus]|uniref:Uncharacterized protein n=1 Tax=Ceratodon purpureus TaxID=3225 RepID=A0A8T0HZR9_CERPU|nr:hypothetical protein KC19_5G076100 [Ceratodon purpureus]